MNKKSTFVKWRRYLPLYLMLIPGVVYIFINNYIPMAGLIMAFEKYDYKLGMFKSCLLYTSDAADDGPPV